LRFVCRTSDPRYPAFDQPTPVLLRTSYSVRPALSVSYYFRPFLCCALPNSPIFPSPSPRAFFFYYSFFPPPLFCGILPSSCFPASLGRSMLPPSVLWLKKHCRDRQGRFEEARFDYVVSLASMSPLSLPRLLH